MKDPKYHSRSDSTPAARRRRPDAADGSASVEPLPLVLEAHFTNGPAGLPDGRLGLWGEARLRDGVLIEFELRIDRYDAEARLEGAWQLPLDLSGEAASEAILLALEPEIQLCRRLCLHEGLPDEIRLLPSRLELMRRCRLEGRRCAPAGKPQPAAIRLCRRPLRIPRPAPCRSASSRAAVLRPIPAVVPASDQEK